VKEIEEDTKRKWKLLPCSHIRKINIVQIFIQTGQGGSGL
jgi:hypothetical protein